MLPTVEPAAAKLIFQDDDDHERRLAAIISKVAEGDHAALAELYDVTSRVVFSLAFRIVADRALAEEVTLDVFTYVWRQAGRYDPARAVPSAWLLMLTR